MKDIFGQYFQMALDSEKVIKKAKALERMQTKTITSISILKRIKRFFKRNK